jgi:hypothetical protein
MDKYAAMVTSLSHHADSHLTKSAVHFTLQQLKLGSNHGNM